MNAAAQAPERSGAALYSRAAVVRDTLSVESRSVDVVASSEALDAHGTILKANWDLARYKSNPVVLYAHDQSEIPIGLASNVRVEDELLRATLTFSTADLNPKAEQVWLNVQAEVIRGVSVGFGFDTVRFEVQEGVERVVLDDLELWEISMVPVPSNPEALASMRARALSSRAAEPAPEPVSSIEPEPTPTTEPLPAAATQPAPVAQGRTIMTDSSISTTILRALGLPAGSTENDALACIARMRELEVGVVASCNLQSTAEALGAHRGLKAKADKFDEVNAKLAAVEAERDLQNFEVQVQRAVNERKMSKASIEGERRDFAEALSEGRGARAVSRLKGFLDTAPVLHSERIAQPRTDVVNNGAPLEWNGVAYRDLPYAKRARLSKEDPELYRLMKDEWEAAGCPPAKSAA